MVKQPRAFSHALSISGVMPYLSKAPGIEIPGFTHLKHAKILRRSPEPPPMVSASGPVGWCPLEDLRVLFSASHVILGDTSPQTWTHSSHLPSCLNQAPQGGGEDGEHQNNPHQGVLTF